MTDQTPPAPQPQPAGPLSAAEDKQWASFAHFGGVLFILPSLIIFLVFKDRGNLTKQESKEALNWQITFAIIYIAWVVISTIISSALIFTSFWWLGGLFGFITFLLWVGNVILSIMGGIKVNGGGSYRYPFNFRFIK
ncbi:MAG: DUF4870 domain-containing protein [Microbacteriaceae bacterium]|nr:DUF4870 domain-containing protein [Cryobacterium sp.]MBX3104244.1 DUF4870 domain-containing protein [Cryobacterium sp.]MCC6377002.1 DUF4870 domain-containing protein [Microbacteriaceae bacterium]